MSIDDPLSQESPRPPAAASATTAYLEDDPEAAGGGGASFGGAQPSFEQEPKGAPPGTSQRRDSSSGRGGEHMWTSANPVAGAGPRSYPAAANQGFVDAASADEQFPGVFIPDILTLGAVGEEGEGEKEEERWVVAVSK